MMALTNNQLWLEFGFFYAVGSLLLGLFFLARVFGVRLKIVEAFRTLGLLIFWAVFGLVIVVVAWIINFESFRRHEQKHRTKPFLHL